MKHKYLRDRQIVEVIPIGPRPLGQYSTIFAQIFPCVRINNGLRTQAHCTLCSRPHFHFILVNGCFPIFAVIDPLEDVT